MADIRQELFGLLKDIIDGEWGPYDDDHYWPMVDDFMARVGMTQEWGVKRPQRSEGDPVWRSSQHWCRERAAFLNDRYGPGEAEVVSRWVCPGNVVSLT